MAGAETGHALGDFQALDPPLEGDALGRAPGQRNGVLVVLPGRGVAAAPPFQVSPGRPVEGVPGQLPLPAKAISSRRPASMPSRSARASARFSATIGLQDCWARTW
jgi:hypothetical protein